jgi:hypothetical protein
MAHEEDGSSDGMGDYFRDVKAAQKRARQDAGVAMSGKKFYAVARGHNTGIFRSWEEARPQVEGFSGALHKGFGSREEAARWMNGQ